MRQSSLDERVDFAGLDALRAVGAFAVLTTHVAFQTGAYTRHGTVGALLARLDVGVAIFFVLSGFLLSRPWWARAEMALPSPRVRPYARKRIRRILPVYVITVIAALALLPENADRGVWSWLVTLTLTDTFLMQALPQGLTHMWSLGVEVTFYALLPILMRTIIGRGRPTYRRVSLAFAMLLAINVLWIIWWAPSLASSTAGVPNLWLPGYLSWFAAGMLLAFMHVKATAGRDSAITGPLIRLGQQPGSCWVAAIGLLLVSATPLAGPLLLEIATPSQALAKNLIYAIIGLLLVAAGVWADPRTWSMRVMSARIVRHLGHISYSMFCVHLAVLTLILDAMDYQLFTGDFARIWASTVGVTIVVSEALYWLVERPFTSRRSVKATQAATDASASSAK